MVGAAVLQVFAETDRRADVRRHLADRPHRRELARVRPVRRRALRPPRRLNPRVVDLALEERSLLDGTGKRRLPGEVRREPRPGAVRIRDDEYGAEAVLLHVQRPRLHPRPPGADGLGAEDILRALLRLHQLRDVVGKRIAALLERRIAGEEPVVRDRLSVHERPEDAPSRHVPAGGRDLLLVDIRLHVHRGVGFLGLPRRLHGDELGALPVDFAAVQRPKRNDRERDFGLHARLEMLNRRRQRLSQVRTRNPRCQRPQSKPKKVPVHLLLLFL